MDEAVLVIRPRAEPPRRSALPRTHSAAGAPTNGIGMRGRKPHDPRNIGECLRAAVAGLFLRVAAASIGEFPKGLGRWTQKVCVNLLVDGSRAC